MPEDVVYAPLALNDLHLNGELSFDFYIEKKHQYVLYTPASAPFTMSECHRLLATGVSSVWIPIAAPDWPPSHLLKILDLSDTEVPPLTKANLVFTPTVDVAGQIYSRISQQFIDMLDDLIGVMADYLTTESSAFSALGLLVRHDPSLHAHAINGALYAMGLAIHLGMHDSRELRELGLGAALRDVGHSSLPENLLNKRMGLTPDEWEIVRRHPDKGVEVLQQMADLPDTVLAIVAQHHERNDGSGYPKGLTETEVHPLAQIVSLVDAYVAMTSPRPHRAPRSPYNALLELRKEVGERYSLEFFTSLLTILADPAQVGLGIGPERLRTSPNHV